LWDTCPQSVAARRARAGDGQVSHKPKHSERQSPLDVDGGIQHSSTEGPSRLRVAPRLVSTSIVARLSGSASAHCHSVALGHQQKPPDRSWAASCG
jgi:hypothetical protein